MPCVTFITLQCCVFCRKKFVYAFIRSSSYSSSSSSTSSCCLRGAFELLLLFSAIYLCRFSLSFYRIFAFSFPSNSLCYLTWQFSFSAAAAAVAAVVVVYYYFGFPLISNTVLGVYIFCVLCACVFMQFIRVLLFTYFTCAFLLLPLFSLTAPIPWHFV